MLASLATIMKEKTALVTSMVYFALTFIAVMGFGLTCFSIGYTFGKDNHKPQK